MSVPRVVLVGPSGGGRTSVGLALAEQMGLPLIETEMILADEYGQPFTNLALRLDGDQLRDAAARASIRVLSGEGIVTLLPSALDEELVTARLAEILTQGVPVVAVTAELSVLVRRAGLNAPRSAALGQPRKWFRDFVVAQREKYRSLGIPEFDTGTATPTRVAEQIAVEFALQ